MIKTNVYTETQ